VLVDMTELLMVEVMAGFLVTVLVGMIEFLIAPLVGMILAVSLTDGSLGEMNNRGVVVEEQSHHHLAFHFPVAA